jgi:hypothetical protein
LFFILRAAATATQTSTNFQVATRFFAVVALRSLHRVDSLKRVDADCASILLDGFG